MKNDSGYSRETVAEDPVTPMMRLAVCLYKLARGDYLHTIAELAGLGTATVCFITKEVCETSFLFMGQICDKKHAK